MIYPLPLRHEPSHDASMVDFSVRLPSQVASRLREYADNWNVPIQALVVSALQAAFAKQEAED